jgi:hypothetical protein
METSGAGRWTEPIRRCVVVYLGAFLINMQVMTVPIREVDHEVCLSNKPYNAHLSHKVSSRCKR